MVRSLVVLLVVVAGCKQDSASGGGAGSGSGSGSAVAGSGSAAGSAADPGTAPAMTPEQLFAEGATPFIETRKGFLLVIDDGPADHKCRVELGTALVRIGKVLQEAKALQSDPEFMDPTSCAARGRYAVCDYEHPVIDETNADTQASWVFVADAGKPRLVAVLLGKSRARFATLEPELAQDRECPRPGAD